MRPLSVDGTSDGAEAILGEVGHYPESWIEGPAFHYAVSFLDRIHGRLRGFRLFDDCNCPSNSFMIDVAIHGCLFEPTLPNRDHD